MHLPRWARAARHVQRTYSAIGGSTLAAGVTLYSFLAVFALVVLAVAVLGFLSVSNDDLARELARDLGLTGDAARIITEAVRAAQRSRQVTTIVGIAGLLWLGSTWALSLANAYNAAAGVASRGLVDRIRGLGWLAGTSVLIGLSSAATAGWGLLPTAFAPLVVVVSLAGNTAFWLWTSWTLPNRPYSLHVALGPAIAGAVALEALKLAGGYVVPHYVTSSSELYGALGLVIALLLWLLLFGRVVVYLAVVESRVALAADARAGDLAPATARETASGPTRGRP